LITLTALVLSAAAAADTLIDNVRGVTATPFGQVIHFSALLIGDDGKVVRTYADGEKVDLRPKYRIDEHGRVLLPGFIEGAAGVVHAGQALLVKRAGMTGQPPPLGPRDRDLALETSQDDALARGITCLADMGASTIDDWLAYRRAGDLGRLRVRILAYANGVGPMIAIGGGAPTPWLYREHLAMLGARINGILPQGPPSKVKSDDSRLRNEMSRAAMDGFQVAIDTSTDAELTRAKAAISEMTPTYSARGTTQWRLLAEERVAAQGVMPTPLSTYQTAQTLRAGDRIGRLAPGYLADFTLWDENPLENKSNNGPLETWVGGVKVYERKP
jgi:hypothetical protein